MKKKIAVLCCGWTYYFLDEFIKGVKKAVAEEDCDIYIFNCYNYVELSGYPNFTGSSIFNLCHYEDYDGIIFLADLIPNQRILERERMKIVQSGKPAITINAALKDISCIKVDNYSGFYELITHLIKEHNLKNIVYLSGKETSVDFTERYKAYRTALSDNGIELDQNKIYSISKSNFNDAYDFAKELFADKSKIPQAVVCASDLIALGIIKVAQETGIKIPEELKVVGYDDNYFSKAVYPSISTVKSNAEQVGSEAVKRLFSGDNSVVNLKVKSNPIYRQSCGCTCETINDYQTFSLNLLSDEKRNQEFTTQLEVIEEVFTTATDVFTLLTNLELFFQKSHKFEGSDFCIFLKSDWASVFVNSSETLPQNLNYGPQVQAITSIQNNEKYTREIINTRDLIPNKMKSETGCNTYLFMPIFHHLYVHGYIVQKNCLTMLENNYGYTWTRTFGTAIERFRKQNMFKQMSQQFLRLSTRDALSGMLNRVGLDKLAKPFYSQNKQNGLTTVLFFVDINKMKNINDNFGHLHGDLAVKTISASVMEVVPKNWLCIRYGGDEFLVVGNSKNYNGEDYCKIITDRIAKKTSVMHLPYVLSASVGTYSVPPTSNLTLEEAVEKVDEIMYKVKEDYHAQLGDRPSAH